MALEESALPFDESWNICAKKNNGRSACEVFRQFWEAGNRPDAIVAANGQSASGIMSFLYRQGVCIPDDLSIIAYEDSSICGYATPALTAVNIRKEELGFEAAKCLIDRIRHPDKEVATFVAEPYLVRARKRAGALRWTKQTTNGGKACQISTLDKSVMNEIAM